MTIDLNELRMAIRRMLATKNPSQDPLWKVLREELGDRMKGLPRGKPWPKGYDVRRQENKKPAE